jgi:hypothetical protein
MEGTERYKLQLREHLLRMANTRLPKMAYYYRPKGRRYFGRPERKWSDQL